MKGISSVHIGEEIADILLKRHMTKRDLGDAVGLSRTAAVYLTKRESIDALTLQKISIALKYNFFKYYPVDEGEGVKDAGQVEKDKMLAELKAKVSELTQQLEAQKKENAYLNKINELLEKRK